MYTLKRYLFLALSVLLSFSCQEEIPRPVAVQAVYLNATSMELTEGESATLVATISPNDAENKTVIWSSSNLSIASVSNGKVIALKAGKATITVKTDDGGKTATCEVTVNARVYPVTSVSLDKTSATLTEGDELTLTATINPDNATNKNVTWSSSNLSIASVSNGKVTALKAGKATITVKTDDGGKTATCEVTVNAKVYPVTSVSLDKTSATLTEGDELTLIATVNPDNATNKNVAWTSSNGTVASVSNGKVIALKAGKATITVKTDDGGKTATCEVTVNSKVYPVTGVTLDKSSATLTEGDELILTATVNPDNATNMNVTWSSSNLSIASVSNGKVIALKAGKATITVKTDDGGKTATCEVTVNAKVYPVTGVTLDETSATLTEGDELTLTATVNPDNATNKNVTWSSSDNTVASVSNGKVTALKSGKATITVKTDDGGKTATCEVTVNAKVYPVTGVTLDKTSATLTEGDELTLTATVNPDNATHKNVTWTSSNGTVASVSNGKIIALKAGKTTITVKTEDGGKTATCEVTVNAKVYPVTGVTLDKTSATLTEGDELTLTATINPDNATNKNVTWSSSNSAVASVSNGKVTALKAGKATITVKTDDGGKTATCEVTVNAKVYPVISVSLDKTSATLTEGDVFTLTAIVNPDNATNKNITWSSSDNTVASVSNGKVTALKAGKATITVKTDDGGKTATCEVTVNAKVYPVTGVTLDKTSVELKEGDEFTLTATIKPENATNKNVIWSSSDSTVASVSNGKVKSHKLGKVIITARAEGCDKEATCEIKVLAKGAGGNNEGVGENNGNW